MLFSIVIPTFNRGKELSLALESIEQQTISSFLYEVVIVDNYSEDNTLEVIKSFKNTLSFLQVHNHGNIAYSRNAGAKNARGKYLVFLDSDDSFAITKLEEIQKILISNEKIKWIYHKIKEKKSKPNGDFFTKKKIPKIRRLKSNQFEDLMLNGNAMVTSGVIIEREIFLKSNGFSEKRTHIGVEDFELWVRLTSMKLNAFFVDRELTYYGLSHNSESTLSKSYINKTLAIYREFRSKLMSNILRKKNKGLASYTYARMYIKYDGYLSRKNKLLCTYAIINGNLRTKTKAFLTLLRVF